MLEIGGSVRIGGGILDRAARHRLNANAARVVKALTEEGADLVRAGIKTKHGTGYTRNLIEAYQNRDGSLYGKVRAKPGQLRHPGSPRYPAERRPYITTSVLESGRMGGHKVLKVRVTSSGTRVRQTYKRGARVRVPLNMFRNALRELRRRAATIRAEALTKGIE